HQIAKAKVFGIVRVEQSRLKQEVLGRKRHGLARCNRSSPVVLKTATHVEVFIHVHVCAPCMRTFSFESSCRPAGRSVLFHGTAGSVNCRSRRLGPKEETAKLIKGAQDNPKWQSRRS